MRAAETQAILTIMRSLCLALLVLLPACFRVGNDLNGTCAPGESCVCDLIGNCSRSCPAGGCTFECRGTGNCLFSCEAGGCNTICANTGNCITECEAGDCTSDCRQNVGTCIVNGAPDLSVKVVDLSTPDLTSHD